MHVTASLVEMSLEDKTGITSPPKM